MIDKILETKPDGVNLQEVVRSDRHWFICRTCRKKHEEHIHSDAHLKAMFEDFQEKHPTWRGCYTYVLTPDRVKRVCDREQLKKKAKRVSVRNFLPNNDLKLALGAAQSLTITALNSLASSATAGWCSGNIDNSSLLYVDLICGLTLAAVNTAPGSDKCVYQYAACSTDTTDLPTSGASSSGTVATTQGTLTFPSVSSLPCLFPLANIMPYPVQNVALQGSWFGIARAFNGLLGPQIWLPVINFTGFTIAATGNAYKYRGAYFTV